MKISDGFKLGLGKFLSDLTISIVIAVVVGVLIYLGNLV